MLMRADGLFRPLASLGLIFKTSGMQAYLDLMRRILEGGVEKSDRTGTGTLSLFGAQMRFDLNEGFPLVTTKKLHLKSIIHELIWFLAGDTNTKYLKQNGVSIWDEWEDANGDLGPVYGKQWRSWQKPDGGTVDQIKDLLSEYPPQSRFAAPDRFSLEPGGYSEHGARAMPLPVPVLCRDAKRGAKPRLSCQLYQRSADFFLGVPFNIASYALLTHMIADLRHHMRQQRIGGDIERHAEKQIRRALVELAGERGRPFAAT